MSTITASSSAISRGVVLAPKVVEQAARVNFLRTYVTAVDAVAKLKDARTGSKTTKLTVELSLQAGQQYNLRRAPATRAGPLTATLINASGQETALDFSTAFTVGSSGQYKLRLSAAGAIKRDVDGVSLEARFSSQTANLGFTRAYSYDSDAVLNLRDANLGYNAKKLTVNLSLLAGQSYSFSSSGYLTSLGQSVALIDAAGHETSLSGKSSFSVAASGQYQMRIEGSSALKGSLDSVSIKALVTLPTSSGDSRIDALVRGGTRAFWNNSDAPAVAGIDQIKPGANALVSKDTPNVVTFGFFTSALGTAQDKYGFKVMTKAQKAAVRRVFDYYGKLINVTFREVAGNGTADINFGTNNQRGVSAGYSYYPKMGPIAGKTSLMLANDQWSNTDPQVQEGGYGYETLLHEVGHALGLKHPGNYNAGGGSTPGPFLPAGEDDRQHTIMSYYDNNASRYVNPTTAMVYDVAALQYLYGVNKTASTATNGAFTFTAGKNYLQTLWSATGNDTIDLTSLTNASRVDLNAGAYSSINIVAPSSRSYYSGNNNVGIAYGAKINNVKLSSAAGVAETVTLNDAFNSGAYDVITSFNASDDTLVFKQSLFGSLGADSLEFGTEATTSNTKLIVNTATGEVFYDADGNGAAVAAKKIAQYQTVQNQVAMSARNFSFVA